MTLLYQAMTLLYQKAVYAQHQMVLMIHAYLFAVSEVALFFACLRLSFGRPASAARHATQVLSPSMDTMLADLY